MKSFLMSLVVILSAVQVVASPYFGIPIKDTDGIERQIEQALLKEVGFDSLQEFKVDWTPSSFKCMQVEPSEINPADVGVCVVNVHAFQVLSKVAIIRKQSGYDVSVIYADVE